jgi:hypothetical protein
MTVHRGGCHCGRVRFEAEAPSALEVLECNCSICHKLGYLHLVVPKADFRLISGAEFLTAYEFNTRTAKHLFCKVCGVKSFYVPRSHPESYSINARCLEDGTVQMMTVTPFDGQHWEEAAEALAPLTPA